MDTIIERMIEAIFAGGPNAVIGILALAICLLLIDRRRLVADVQRRDERIEKIVDDYHKGNMTLAEALTSLKLVLFEIRSKM